MIHTENKGEWFELTVPKNWQGHTITKVFKEIWMAPKKQIHYLRMNKQVRLNGESANWEQELNAHDKLQIQLFIDIPMNLVPFYKDLNIIYEDSHLLVVNKPANMSTHPNSPEETDSLSNAVAYHLLAQGEARKIKHIHRLDKDTTGAILFAKHDLMGSMLDGMLEKREIKRTYLALVHGLLKQKKGEIHLPIGRDRHHPTRRRVSPSGQDAITHFEVLKKDIKKNTTLIKCSLDTGRTHQIRVHLSHIGHPLVGDNLYGGQPIFLRPALHAVKMEFLHPFTMEEIVCHAPFLDEPPIFQEIDPYDL
ncbi:RluA family pseudouridine synthase [Cytobacillus sp. Hz8]|uniref:RluA family pseudouridine synthase n=1 Tax=Cytobacillus sp. Hz8 TaxID=3347168 RepID=UPI0035E3963C